VKIWFRLHGYEPCSWTSVWQYLRVAFEDIGVEVYDVVPPDNPQECVELWWGDPQFFRWSDEPVKAKVALALSEAHSIRAEGKQNVIRNLACSDMIICPSEFATTAFREAPFDVPIRIAFFGVDPDEFPFVEREWSGQLRFLHAGVTQFRKGSWLVPEAFISAFSRDDDVALTIASPRSSPMFTRLKSEYDGQRNITFHMTREESTMSLYKKHHIYVSPHLSEGYGLMPVEAMSTGMAAIMARCSAPTEYFDKDYGSWIEMSEDYALIAQCLPETSGFWRLPDLDSLAEQMRAAYECSQEFEEKGVAASEYVHSQLTWRMTAEQIASHIEEVLDEKNISRDDRLQRGRLVTGPSGKYITAC
jgi:glycosyltransferase involved in cell wall biosynthesis